MFRPNCCDRLGGRMGSGEREHEEVVVGRKTEGTEGCRKNEALERLKVYGLCFTKSKALSALPIFYHADLIPYYRVTVIMQDSYCVLEQTHSAIPLPLTACCSNNIS